VLPTRYGEGVPRFLIEAAACGLPIITTDSPGCRDVVDSSSSGYLCQSTGDIVYAMQRLLADAPLRTEMGARSRELATRFDISRVMDDMLCIYMREISQ
jgi:glycosyltransferase involved in cell wall biosynthesis